MQINVVFRLENVSELGDLYKALKETATLQAKHQLEERIKNLKREKDALEKEVHKLSAQKDDLSPDTKKSVHAPMEEATEEAEPEPEGVETTESSAFMDEVASVIDNIERTDSEENSHE